MPPYSSFSSRRKKAGWGDLMVSGGGRILRDGARIARSLAPSYGLAGSSLFSPPSIPRNRFSSGRSLISRTTARATSRGASQIRVGRVHNEGTGGQYSYFTMKPGRPYIPKSVEDTIAPQVLVNNAAYQLKSNVGVQNVVAPLTLITPNNVAYYTGDKVTRMMYQKASGDVTMNNIFLSNCYVIIYDIIARKDCALTGVSSPINAWSQGDADESATSTYTYLGSTPWQSELFNQYYKVMQVTNIVLGAGATHVHKVRLTPNKVFSAANATYSPYGFRDQTYWCMVEIHGSPANDTVLQSQVSVGVGGLNLIVDSEATIKQLAKAVPTIQGGNSLPTAFTNAEQVVNLGGSTIVPQAEG